MNTVVAYIPTPAGERALEAAIDRASLSGSTLTIVNIVREDREGDARHASDEQLTYAAQSASRAGVRTVDTRSIHVPSGDELPEALLDEVARTGASLLVVGARRDTDTPIHMLGLTLQHIIVASPVSVLVA